MVRSVFISLIQNIAVLLAFSMIYDYLWNKSDEIRNYKEKILAGIIIGAIGIFLIFTPWTLREGLLFDSRSILLSVSGLFFGAVPTVIAMAITAAYRVYIGGSGMLMGVAVILTSGGIGLLWRWFFPPRSIKKPVINLLLLGLFVHLAMLGCTFLLPSDVYMETLRSIILPLFVVYTPGTMLLGLLMLRHLSNWQARKDKEESEKKYRQLVENAGEGILVIQEGYIRFVNPRGCRILEYDDKELTTKPFSTFIHPEDRKNVLQRNIDGISGKESPENYSFRMLPESGRIKWIEVNSVPLEWESRPATLNFFNDITKKRQTERQLKAAKEKAEKSDRLKSVFLANMSHEIRTPMNAIIGFSDMLINDGLSKEKEQDYLRIIQGSGRRLLQIINDIVDISKLETGLLKMYPQIFSLYEIFAQSIETFKNDKRYREKTNVTLRMIFPESHRGLKVKTDPYRLRQLIDNLLDNAIKHTSEGIIELGCSCKDKNRYVELTVYVRDTGRGISKEKQKIIFEHFRQAEEESFNEGAGLGLSICKGIVGLLGGRIWLESEPGNGSCFYFFLSLERAEDIDKNERKEKPPVPDLKDMEIIIAEDDPGSYYLLNMYLRDTGAVLRFAADGVKLMNMLEEKLPDLLLLDINLAEIDGYTCLKLIREKGYSLKIIAQTAYAMQNEKQQCLSAGCHGYVAKPFDKKTLLAEIVRVLSDTSKHKGEKS